ncbi:MAG: L,D-transpeptidase [Candidatus Levybacteria bacterium]|nr:L,D-transpeptidase [Candidatus Levybacteria bacterium]
MKKMFGRIFVLIILGIAFLFVKDIAVKSPPQVLFSEIKPSYWFLLHRKSNMEYLYMGPGGDVKNSELLRTFKVKTGIPGERPTPLPQILGKKYWLIIQKHVEKDNPETAPYFITLNIPVGEEEPFGPQPYIECLDYFTGEMVQCNWTVPGAFGLHGTGGNPNKLSNEDPGSSGCIRHRDEDITYLYNLLDPSTQEIRYYIEDK